MLHLFLRSVPHPSSAAAASMVSDVVDFNSPTTLTALAKDPHQPASRIVKQLFKTRRSKLKEHTDTLPSEEADELDLVAKCGSFPHRPSDLFLRVR
jgi:hypothetical protein